MNSQKSFWLGMLSAIALIVLLASSFYLGMKNQPKQPPTPTPSQNIEQPDIVLDDEPEIEYEKISNSVYGFFVTSIQQTDSGYLFQGVLYNDYIITESEFEEIKAGKPIILNDEKYTYTNIIDEVEGNYLTSEKSPLIYYLSPSEGGYFLSALTQTLRTWKATNKFIEIKVQIGRAHV